ncbi:hypothetical protein GmHk_13G036484 [Glycine max]|nr:hypothetical protein GmHk_13G036484 [Glycine max]
MQSQFQSQMQSQGLELLLEAEVSPSAARVSTKESCVDPSWNDPDMGDSDKCRLYIEENSPRLVALGRAYEGSTTVHNIPLFHDQVKVGVEEVRDADAPIPNSKRDVYLGAYLNGAHWQMVIILPKENVVIWFCSLHNKPDNYLKGIINSALKGLDDTPQSKSKAGARWIIVKISNLNNAFTYILYFNDTRPLKLERFKALRIQWTKYYLKVKNET